MSPLTREQLIAATTHSRRSYIEAPPGSGKTTVAAERYGVLRFTRSQPGRGTLGLTFARSARSELEDRIRRRWGGHALAWPNGVFTFDALHCALLTHLLRTNALEWVEGHKTLIVIDTWRGQPDCRRLAAGAFRRYASVQDGKVVSKRGRIPATGPGSTSGSFYCYSAKGPHEAILASGLCTHEEVRSVLASALTDAALRERVQSFLERSIGHIIVDEAFDANRLDLAVLNLAIAADVGTTLIGDPWQALYDFRGAESALVRNFVHALAFDCHPIAETFRFETQTMRDLGTDLRDGRGVLLPESAVDHVDVILSSQWEPLWNSAEEILPLSFGQSANRTDAALGLLLDRVISRHFPGLATPGPDAVSILGLGIEDLRSGLPAVLDPILAALTDSGEEAGDALLLLRTSLMSFGSKRIPALRDPGEAERVDRLRRLAQRLKKQRLVPGMTVHQAKGREWSHVGLCLSREQRDNLQAGLVVDDPEHRVLYVALTRARRLTTVVGP